MKSHKELIALLQRARKIIPSGLPLMLPEPLNLSMYDHDTGCQARIYLAADGLHTLDVWEGSVWYSSSHEFNDRDKVFGMKPDMLFAQEAVESFFSTVQSEVDAHEARKAERERNAVEEQERRRQNSIEQYKRLLSSGANA